MPENALMKQEDRRAFVQVQDSDELPDLPPPCGMSSTKPILSDEVTPKSEGLTHLLSLDELSLEGLLRPDSPVFILAFSSRLGNGVAQTSNGSDQQ